MTSNKKKHYIYCCLILIAVFWFVAVGIRLIAGDKFLYKVSAGNKELQPIESGIQELCENVTIEQTLSTRIERIETVSVYFYNFGRQNAGTVTVLLKRDDTGETVLQGQFDAAKVENGELLTVYAEKALTGLEDVPLSIIVTSDSKTGEAVCPAYTASSSAEDVLTVNGEKHEGNLAFEIKGSDVLWIGENYAACVVVGTFLLLCYMFFTYCQMEKGIYTLPAQLYSAFVRYKFLIKQLVSRDFKSKYKRSVLGVLWSFLNPLLNMTVQYIVFSNVFRYDIEYFPVYLLCGNIIFSYFSESCSMTLMSIVGNSGLISKVYIPKYIFPMTKVLSSLINLLISLIPLFMVTLICGLWPTAAWLLLPYPLICLAVFALGLGMLLAAGMVFFRDIQFLWGVLSAIWMYLTPIFYPASILEDKLAWVPKVNPLYYFITFVRSCLISGESPEPGIYIMCAVFAAGMLLVGSLVFKKTQDKFALYL